MTEAGQPKTDDGPEPSNIPTSAGPAAETAATIIIPSGLPYAGGPIFGVPSGSIQIPIGSAAAILAQQTVQSWQGPYPPPDAIEKYETVLPGAFDRILSMAERHQAAQIEDTKRAQDYLRDDMRRVHWLGAAITLLSIAGAVTCAIYGSPLVATALVGVPVLSVAKALIDSVRARPSISAPLSVRHSPPPPAAAAAAADPARKTSGASDR